MSVLQRHEGIAWCDQMQCFPSACGGAVPPSPLIPSPTRKLIGTHTPKCAM